MLISEIQYCKSLLENENFDEIGKTKTPIYPIHKLNPKIKLVVITASYSENVEKQKLYERMKNSFSKFDNVEFILGTSGKGYLNYPSNLYFEEKTSQFRMLKKLFEINFDYKDNDIVMFMDDDDTIHHIPEELEEMSYNDSIKGFRSLQGIPLRKGKMINVPQNMDLKLIDEIFPFLTWENDFSGTCLRWKECKKWFSSLILSENRPQEYSLYLIENLLDTQFMNYTETLPFKTAKYPFIYRSPSGGWM